MAEDDLNDMTRRATQAQARAAHAYARLLHLAETGQGGQARHVARFVTGTYNGDTFPFDLFLLRMVDVAIGDDMLDCLDALRWGKADLHKLVPEGESRVQRVIERWGVE